MSFLQFLPIDEAKGMGNPGKQHNGNIMKSQVPKNFELAIQWSTLNCVLPIKCWQGKFQDSMEYFKLCFAHHHWHYFFLKKYACSVSVS
jgi:hypothetical protein